jgi:hypothetical protein
MLWEQHNMLWEQNNILREQYDMLWEQNNLIQEQDNNVVGTRYYIEGTKLNFFSHGRNRTPFGKRVVNKYESVCNYYRSLFHGTLHM